MSLLADVRLAVRSILRRRAFSAMAVLILGVGIGASTAMFSLVDAVLWRAMPYRDVDSLVVVFTDGRARNQAARLGSTAGDYLDWKAESGGVFAGVAALRNESRRITSLESPIVPLVHAVSADYFDVLGVRPMLGRGFVKGEDEPGKNAVVVVSHAVWESAFGADPGLVGRTIHLDGQPHTVVGVLGREFYSAHAFAVQPGLFVPSPFTTLRNERTTRDLIIYARLAPGRQVAEAQAFMTALAARLARDHKDTNDRMSAAVVPLREHAVGRFSATGGILLATVVLVLLIACANVANLTLTRATERTREVALRTALGARRWLVVRPMLVESLVLALLGGALGAAIAWVAAPALAALIPAQAAVPFLDRVAVDWRVLSFALLVSIACGIACGLVPARQASRIELVQTLREGGRGTVVTHGRLRNALVAAEVAVAVIVVSGAALMLRTFTALERVPPGYDADRILKLRTGVRGEEYRTPAARIAYFEELKRRLEAIPGIEKVSATGFEPPVFAGGFGLTRIVIPGAPESEAAPPSAVIRPVLPDFFSTMGIPVLKGRPITAQDTAQSAPVAVVSESMARAYFAGVEPLGRTFAVHGPGSRPMEIVGVVGDVITAGTDPAPKPAFYMPYAQNPLPVMSVVMRVPQGDPMALAASAERAAWSVSTASNVYGIETLDKRLRELNWTTRFGTTLLIGFAALAVLLGAGGIYAVVSYTTLQRRPEIGLRMALGARAADVLRLVVGGGLKPATAGLALGVAASVLLTRALGGFLYGVRPGDPATLLAVSAILLGVAAGASLVPALGAARVDPQLALRE